MAKIGDTNLASQKLFQDLQYTEVGRSAVFKEVTFERSLDTCPLEQLSSMKAVHVGAFNAHSA